MIGKRKTVNDDGMLLLKDGEFGVNRDGIWYAKPPGAGAGMIANLSAHSVTEHEDGTITVSPSILLTDGEGGRSWHGFLERGIWRAA